MTTPKTLAPSGAIDISKFASVGENIKTLVTDGFLFIAVAVTPEVINAARASASGKSKTVGSTLGNVAITAVPGLKIGVNAYVPNSAR